MIEKMTQETRDVLVDIFYTGLEENEPQLLEEYQLLSKKHCLVLLRTTGQEVAQISEEMLTDIQTAYHEIEGLSDGEFEILREEIKTLEVVDLSLVR